MFVDLSDRWVAAAMADEAAPKGVQTVCFPARLVVGSASLVPAGRGALPTPAPSSYLVAGARLTIGGRPSSVVPTAFITRNGSALAAVAPPGVLATDLEDALLCSDVAHRLGLVSQGYALALLSDDENRAARLHAAMWHLADIATTGAGLPAPVPARLFFLGEGTFQEFAQAAEQPRLPSPQCLLICNGNVRLAEASSPVRELVSIPGLYPASEAALLDECRSLSAQHVDVSHAIGYYSTIETVSEDGAPVRLSAKDLFTSKTLGQHRELFRQYEQISATIKDLRSAFATIVLVGPDAHLVAGALASAQITPSLPADPITGFAIIAARAHLKNHALELYESTQPVRALHAAEIQPAHNSRRSRKRAPIRFYPETGEVLIRLPTRALDPALVQTLRVFADATNTSEKSVELLLRLLKVSSVV